MSSFFKAGFARSYRSLLLHSGSRRCGDCNFEKAAIESMYELYCSDAVISVSFFLIKSIAFLSVNAGILGKD